MNVQELRTAANTIIEMWEQGLLCKSEAAARLYEIIPEQDFFHHRASKRGYISRKAISNAAEIIARITPYKGRFGVGYTIARPRWDTNSYYYIDYIAV